MLPETISAAADALPLTPNTPAQEAAAARTLARRASDKDDLVDLLHTIGLPASEDDIAALLPLLPSTDPTHQEGTVTVTATKTELSAFEAMALSMHAAGDPIEQITEATGLNTNELADLGIADATRLDDAGVENLLAWAERHPTKAIQSRATRIRTDLARLAEQQNTERAVAAAEADVAKLRAELARAENTLRTAKAGPTTTNAPVATPKDSKEELHRIRTWARANGHQVADKGLIPRAIREAYTAAHTAPELAKAS
ncbi:Lsr2 family DNA-binding protein [Streptomyces mayteni]